MSDYRKLDIFGAKDKGLTSKFVEKGHREELVAFAQGIHDGTEAIPLWQQVQATEISFEIEKQIIGREL
jgi:hypothetical protein